MSADQIPDPPGEGGSGTAPQPVSVLADLVDLAKDAFGFDAGVEGPTKSYCDSASDPDKACQPLPAQSTLGHVAHWNISAEAEQSFAEIAKRWTDLDTWGVRVKVPSIWKRTKLMNGNTQPSISEEWDAFKVRWINSPDIAELQAAGDDLHTVEGLARDAGYGAGAPPPPQVSVPGVTEGSQTAAAAQTVDTAATAAQKAAESAASGAGASLLGAIPTWMKVLLGVGVVTGVALAVKK